MAKIRILIADDHEIVRKGLRQLLSSEIDMEVIGEAHDGKQAIQMAKTLHPDVILLDIAMPHLGGLEAISLIRGSVPESRIVILSMHSKETYVQQVLAAGAYGYVLKASPNTDVLKAVRAAYHGEYFLSSKLNADVIRAYIDHQSRKSPLRGYDLLSEREQQVFRFVAQGYSTGQMAEILCVSQKTIDKHRSSIMSKLGIHDRLELLKYAIKIGVIDPELWED